MAFRVKADGSIECDSIDEAIALHSRLSQVQTQQASAEPRRDRAPANDVTWTSDHARALIERTSERARALLEIVLDNPSNGLSGKDIADRLGTHARGIGAVLSKIVRDATSVNRRLPAPLHYTDPDELGYRFVIVEPSFAAATRSIRDA